ncbi:MAG: radical SAM protein [Candidatus Omnitrophica bacterium]|nr:radical SAM protein [Candidatus Omnitrophota bacterium]MBU1811386.1 radical SAM protein [Candidatus Omnitrophota bacterium]
MKVALIQCPLWGTYDPPVGLAQLSACVKQAGYKVYTYDLNIKLYLKRAAAYKNVWAWEQGDFWFKEENVKRFFGDHAKEINYYCQQILKEDVRVVGFSVNSASLLASLEVARRIKECNNDIIVVFGGPLFLRKNSIEEILKQECVDVVIPGEGEIAFVELLRAIEAERGLNSSRGIVFRRGKDVIVTSPVKMVDLDSLPFLDLESLPLDDYDDSSHISLMASRGCVRRCHFCSDGPCWPGYRAMSGERIFREVAFYKDKLGGKLGHIDFLDLVFNGSMKSLIDFCDLMIKANLDLHWAANMYVRPELTFEVIKKIKEAMGEHILFGIESGSERVLRLMNKSYDISEAERIIRQMHETGICVTANFMFGFPGEREEDFRQTLNFLRRNVGYLHRVYPSRTYCALEEFSYLESHLEEFGVKPNPPNHLYWESVGGENTYPVRMDRCRKFCELAKELGIEVGAGVQTSVELDEQRNLGDYYEAKRDYNKAIECFLKAYELDPIDGGVKQKIFSFSHQLKKGEFVVDCEMKEKVMETIQHIEQLNDGNKKEVSVGRLGREYSSILIGNQLRTHLADLEKYVEKEGFKENVLVQNKGWLLYDKAKDMREGIDKIEKYRMKDDLFELYTVLGKKLSYLNAVLNDREYEQKKVGLTSYPKSVFLQFAGPCNSSCVFCSRGRDYDFFNLERFKANIEKKIKYGLSLAERFIYTGSGEFLQLPQWKEILDYFDYTYPHVEKMFSTNGSSLRPEVCELMTSHHSRYLIHSSLHASHAKSHSGLTRMDNFAQILENLRYLNQLRKKSNNVGVNFIFVATTLNIEDLPNFVKLAREMEADKVVVYYNFIYVPAQKYLSCFFKPDLTNKMFALAEKIAGDLEIRLELPPRFGLSEYPQVGPCRELWSQIMFNDKGDVLPCDASIDCDVSLENNTYEKVWNSEYYSKVRSQLVDYEHSECFNHCHRANPFTVNLFETHVIHRGRKEEKIDLLWGDNF